MCVQMHVRLAAPRRHRRACRRHSMHRLQLWALQGTGKRDFITIKKNKGDMLGHYNRKQKQPLHNVGRMMQTRMRLS